MMNLLPAQSIQALKVDGSGANEQMYITPTTLDGVAEVQKIVHPAVAALGQGDFYKLTNYAGTTFAIWFDIDANGTAPNGPIYSACDVSIMASVSTGGTAADVATAAKAAMDAEVLFVGFTLVKSSADITFTSTITGNLTAPASYVEAETAGPFTASTVTGGSDPTVKGKYFTIKNSTTGFYYWFTNNGVGTDPAVASHTSKEIALVGDESQAGFLAAIEAVIEATSGLSSSVDGSRIVVSVDAVATATDISAGDSGFTVEVRSQGYAQQYAPAMNLQDDSTSPSLLS